MLVYEVYIYRKGSRELIYYFRSLEKKFVEDFTNEIIRINKSVIIEIKRSIYSKLSSEEKGRFYYGN